PNRLHIVLSRQDVSVPNEVLLMNKMEEVLQYIREAKASGEEVFVIGGGNLYEQMLPHADRLYVTEIATSFTGDVYFPTINRLEWQEKSRIEGEKNEENPYDYDFVIYERIVAREDEKIINT